MVLDWSFPLSRPHEGIALGNGSQGVLVWGDEVLCLTVAKAGFWERRGGTPFTLAATFSKVRAALEAGDENALRALFSAPNRNENAPDRPQQIGGARLELRFEGDFFPVRGALELETGILTVELENAAGHTREISLFQSMDADVLVIEGAHDAQIRLRPTWEWVGETLEE